MAYLRILSWLVSICVAMALQVQAVGNVVQSPLFTQSYSEQVSDAGEEYYSFSAAGPAHDFHETAHARRRYNDRNSCLCFNEPQDKAADKKLEQSAIVQKCHSQFNNICLSSCYDFIFRLSPF